MTAGASFDDKQPRDERSVLAEEALSNKKGIERASEFFEGKSGYDLPKENSTPVSGNTRESGEKDAREDDATSDTPCSRADTLIPFSNSFESRQTLCQRQNSPDGRAQTPCSIPGTPPLTTTMSSPSSPKTPDTAGIQTPSTPRTPIQSAPRVSHTDSIRRKPVPTSSRDNLGEGSEGQAPAARNPLEKATVSIVPELLREKAASMPDSRPRTRVNLPRKRKRTGWGRVKRVGRLWWVEGVWCCVALLCIVGEFFTYTHVNLFSPNSYLTYVFLLYRTKTNSTVIFAVLSAYNNQPLPAPLHLPALLAFLTTLSTLSLLLPVTECISQWKWNHLRADTRSLSDFQLFDSASRSPFGSAVLLFKLRHRSFSSFGAVVFLLAVLGPAVSQVAVGYGEGVVVAGGEASVRVMRNLEGEVESLRGAVEDGVEGGVGVCFPVVCDAGQCRFEPFQGLGICAEVRDITDRLTVVTSRRIEGNSTAGDPIRLTRRSYNVTLPQGPNCHLTTSQPLNVLTCKTSGSTTLSFDGGLGDTAIYSMPIIYSNTEDGDEVVEFEALEVLFHLCLNTYSASVRDGQPGFKTIKTSASLAPGSADKEVDVECETPTSGSEVECEAGDVPANAFMKLEDPGGDSDVEVSAQFRALTGIAVVIGEGMSGQWMRGGNVSITLGTRLMEGISSVIYEGENGQQKDRVEKLAGSIANSLTNV